MGGFKLFKLFGITVYLDWTWFLLALLEFQWAQEAGKPGARYDFAWLYMLEFLAIFAIVTVHEFGHALACRSVGGKADTILLWPLGGVAFVEPPMRPGAVLWSIAAGPLVNVVLVPILFVAMMLGAFLRIPEHWVEFLFFLNWINGALLIFNMLPVYPLDGGQILQSILWFFIGYARSLRIATFIGLAAATGLGILALSTQRWMLLLVAGFIFWRCYVGAKAARQLLDMQAQGQAPANL